MSTPLSSKQYLPLHERDAAVSDKHNQLTDVCLPLQQPIQNNLEQLLHIHPHPSFSTTAPSAQSPREGFKLLMGICEYFSLQYRYRHGVVNSISIAKHPLQSRIRCYLRGIVMEDMSCSASSIVCR